VLFHKNKVAILIESTYSSIDAVESPKLQKYW